jgi:hypothetical protein
MVLGPMTPLFGDTEIFRSYRRIRFSKVPPAEV